MNRVVVTGLGFVSSIGNNRGAVLDSLRTGKTGIAVMPALLEAGARISLAGPVEEFEFPTPDPLDWIFPKPLKLSRAQLRTLTPNALYAIMAMDEAIRDAGLAPEHVSCPDTGLYCGAGGSPWMAHVALDSVLTRGPMRTSAPTVMTGMPNALHLNLSAHYAIKGASLGFSSACASSAHALGSACDLIRWGRQKIMLVAGADDCHPCNILPFASLRALSPQRDPALAPRAFDAARDGFVVTGGAAVLVLEDAAHAARRNATLYGEIRGWGQASDGYDTVAPEPNGEGLARAMLQALGDAGISPAQVDYLNAHATGTVAGDLAEIRAIKKVFAGGRIPEVSSTKSQTGHGLSLAGALEAGICCLALREGFMPVSLNISQLDPACDEVPIVTTAIPDKPRVIISNSSGFGGSNVAIVLQLP
jgi:3-oxoacyl-[acyl-carrier-protein] synthase-1